jgi:ABC-type nitrate/sulfonate/bicarbonate transport system substrate-binding protein
MSSPTMNRLVVVVVVAGLLLTTGCGKAPVPKIPGTTPPTSAAPWQMRPDVKELALGEVLEVPYILWGGDVATALANGGATTQPGSLFAQHGLKLKLVRGDNFAEQIKNYKDGKTPFLRGTMSMLGQASGQIGGDPRSQPVVFLQLTWSAGDHLVARADCKTLADLKGKRIALQKGGPHVGMLDDILRTAQLGWQDVRIEWRDEVTGDKGPGDLFRKDPGVDACFAVTPDMMDLTGGPDATGNGERTTVSGAHVLVSTAQMLRSIADVYACRKDFFDKHRDVIEKFTAGYLKACEELLAIKKTSKDKTPAYQNVLALTRKMFGDDLRNDGEAEGLIADAVFVGLPGNYSFFKDKSNLSGFEPKARAAVDLALRLQDASVRYDLSQANLDYALIKKLGKLAAKVDAPRTDRFGEATKEKGVIYSFAVLFKGGKYDFPEAEYGQHFQRAVEQASLFGNAAISIRGHANAVDLMFGFRDSVLKRNIVKQNDGQFFLQDGSVFAMHDMKAILELIHREKLGNVMIPRQGRPAATMQVEIDDLQKLSEQRAAAVRQAVLTYAANHGYRVEQKQMRSVGVGGVEPVVMFPPNDAEGQKNRRVEFRIIALAGEGVATDDFDF